MFDDVAVPYLQDWQLWEWVTWSGLLAAAVVVAAGWRRYRAWVVERTDHWLPTIAVPVVAGIGSLTGLLWLPHALMRHISDQRTVGWLFLGLLAVAGVLAVLAWRDADDLGYYDRTRYLTYVGSIALALGTVVGGADDALNRFASTIPTSVAALLLAIIGLAALGGGFAATRR